MSHGQWYEFLERVRASEDAMKGARVWYRGVSSFAHSLVPSIHRAKCVDAERDLFRDFSRLRQLLPSTPDGDWNTLFAMQHYGVPTRLLDWTEALGIAVGFAILGSSATRTPESAAVYLLDVDGLNKESGVEADAVVKKLGYCAMMWEADPFRPVRPIAVVPSLDNRRMYAQRAGFTLHGSDARPIEAQCPSCITKVELRPQAFDGALAFLSDANISLLTLYPDMIGAAQHLRRKYSQTM